MCLYFSPNLKWKWVWKRILKCLRLDYKRLLTLFFFFLIIVISQKLAMTREKKGTNIFRERSIIESCMLRSGMMNCFWKEIYWFSSNYLDHKLNNFNEKFNLFQFLYPLLDGGGGLTPLTNVKQDITVCLDVWGTMWWFYIHWVPSHASLEKAKNWFYHVIHILSDDIMIMLQVKP